MVAALAAAACGGRTPTGGDGGEGGCDGEAPDCPWGTCLDGPVATCVDGNWSCPSPPDSCGASTVCGDTVCDATQYCQVSSGGPPPPPDAGPSVGYSCELLPSACLVNGPPTCACIEQQGGCGVYGQVVQCDDPGGVTIECAFP
jgi:hypothetical protein